MPAPFSFANVVNAPKSATVMSGAIAPIGYDTPAEVAVVGGQVRINGGAWTSLVTYIAPGETIELKLTTPNAWATQASATVTIGGRSSTWSVTTGTASSGNWDSGWKSGTWNISTPQFFSWFRVQLWGPGAGGGGGGGIGAGCTSGGAGTSAGIARFNGGPYATGGGYGTGGQWAIPSAPRGANGTTSGVGTGVGGDTNTSGGGALGGGGGAGGVWGSVVGGTGGTGGNGGYCSKTYYWGEIAALLSCLVELGAPGVGGPGGSGYIAGASGAGGGYGRCYIDWG
ncbi:hypothetical protein BJ122_102269 [Rhodopseudomonas faecalis]|uniref:Uncharacterized protein n=1 Tax=Rhodopseudomonas faecalis TaxID=99655 RepID=A0A318TKV4_9BRAD|nr:hypothetical protein [Rhodopseudomonas faecalis]PYF05043.1 hypothetical protein BJ122_102269 [Rhodopseudomonas faecalis]